ncbi:MAG: DUF4372 domain-containing protein [Bacteroidetes bacterium]|nr:DUF4372 domain-containing protein [Bacteroidota bacterium]
MTKKAVFTQILQLLNRDKFRNIIKNYDGDRYTKRLNCWQQFLILLYAQARGIKSLRDIEISLRSQRRKWYHPGLKNVARSTLLDANSKRSSEIFRDIFYDFIVKCRGLAPKHKFKFKNPI